MASKKVTYLIDGFNLYHSVRRAQNELNISTKWLNIKKLCKARLPNIRSTVDSMVELENIYYFSAYAYHLNEPSVVDRHKRFVKYLRGTVIRTVCEAIALMQEEIKEKIKTDILINNRAGGNSSSH